MVRRPEDLELVADVTVSVVTAPYRPKNGTGRP
jgi:hypothetical protein